MDAVDSNDNDVVVVVDSILGVGVGVVVGVVVVDAVDNNDNVLVLVRLMMAILFDSRFNFLLQSPSIFLIDVHKNRFFSI